jgi:hypothetical protein
MAARIARAPTAIFSVCALAVTTCDRMRDEFFEHEYDIELSVWKRSSRIDALGEDRSARDACRRQRNAFCRRIAQRVAETDGEASGRSTQVTPRLVCRIEYVRQKNGRRVP